MLSPPPPPPDPDGSLAVGGLVECEAGADSDDTWSSSSADGGEVAETGPMQAAPVSFGSIAVENSSDVHIGATHIHLARVGHFTVACPNGGHALATAADRHLPAIAGGGVRDLHLPDDDEPDGTATDTASASKTRGGLSVKIEFCSGAPRSRIIAAIGCVTLLVVVALCILIGFVSHTPDSSRDEGRSTTIIDEHSTRIPSPSPSLPIICSAPLGYEGLLIPRRSWTAREPSGPIDCLPLPVDHIIGYEDRSICNDLKTCARLMHDMQAKHMDVWGFEDIAYNFIVTGDDDVFEGRGWCVQGRHNNGSQSWRNVSIAVGCLTNWVSLRSDQAVQKPSSRDTPWNARAGLKKFVAWGKRLGGLRHNVSYISGTPWPES